MKIVAEADGKRLGTTVASGPDLYDDGTWAPKPACHVTFSMELPRHVSYEFYPVGSYLRTKERLSGVEMARTVLYAHGNNVVISHEADPRSFD